MGSVCILAKSFLHSGQAKIGTSPTCNYMEKRGGGGGGLPPPPILLALATIFTQPEWKEKQLTTVFFDTRLWKAKHRRKRFQTFRHSCVLLTDRVEIHRSQLDSMTWKRLEGHTSGCNWWISIRSVNTTQDWPKFSKRFRGYFVFQSRVSTKTVVTIQECLLCLL